MTSLEDAVIARYEHAGEHFEIFVDPDRAQAYKAGAKKDLEGVLAAFEVFKDARKGDRPNEASVKKAFGTNDINQIADIILRKGELAYTTEQRHKMLAERTKQIVAIIARESMDPRTNAPHPPKRIENALEQAKVHIDPLKRAEEQVDTVIQALRPIIPIKIARVQIAVKIPPEFAPKAYGLLKEYSISREEWQKDGSLIALVEMPAGVQGEFYDRVNKLTSGKVETKLLTT